MNIKRIVILTAAVIWLVAAISFAAAKLPEIAKLLPAKEVTGWLPLEGSLIHGKGTGMTEIYNGAYPEYEKQGITEAVQQIYQTTDKKFLMEIIINKARTEKQAKAFFEKQRKTLGGDQPVKVGKGQMFLVSKKPVQGYIQVKGYVASAVPTYDDDKAIKDATTFLKAVGKKLEKAK